MRLKKRSVIAFIMIFVFSLMFSSGVLGDDSFYSKLGEQIYKVTNTYEVVNTGRYSAYDIKINVHIGADSSSAYQENLGYSIEPSAAVIKRDAAGNVFGEITIKELAAGQSKTITVERYLKNSGVKFTSDIYSLKADYSDFLNNPINSGYIKSAVKIESNAEEILSKAKTLDTKKNTVELAKDIYNFVNLYIEYDTSPVYANKGALSAIKTARGVCDEYASLFAAICRSLGIPSRVVSGYWVTDSLALGKSVDISAESHAWAEFYLPSVGWIPVEPTFRYVYNGVNTPNYNYFANIKEGDRHIITGYKSSEEVSKIGVYYSYVNKTSLSLEIGDEKLTLLSSYNNSIGFKDIGDNWAKSEIERLYDAGILFARQDNKYEPGSEITRGEFSAFLVNTLGLDNVAAAMTFKDVKADHRFIYFINIASSYGLIKGDDLGYFRPEDKITRQDAAVIMERALKLLNASSSNTTALDFVDKDKISDYAYSSVKLIYDMKIMSGKPGKLFDPKGFTTRAEAAKIVDNFRNAIQ